MRPNNFTSYIPLLANRYPLTANSCPLSIYISFRKRTQMRTKPYYAKQTQFSEERTDYNT